MKGNIEGINLKDIYLKNINIHGIIGGFSPTTRRRVEQICGVMYDIETVLLLGKKVIEAGMEAAIKEWKKEVRMKIPKSESRSDDNMVKTYIRSCVSRDGKLVERYLEQGTDIAGEVLQIRLTYDVRVEEAIKGLNEYIKNEQVHFLPDDDPSLEKVSWRKEVGNLYISSNQDKGSDSVLKFFHLLNWLWRDKYEIRWFYDGSVEGYDGSKGHVLCLVVLPLVEWMTIYLKYGSRKVNKHFRELPENILWMNRAVTDGRAKMSGEGETDQKRK